MKDLYFTSELEIEKILKNKEYLGSGVEGKCYKDNDRVLKFFHNYLENNSIYDDNYYLQFRGIDVDNFYFVKNMIYLGNGDNKKIIGTISNYASGNTLSYSSLYNVSINILIESLKILRNNVLELSKNAIFIDDSIFINNIIYDEKTFKFIDLSNLQYSYEEPYYLFKNNFYVIMREIFPSIINSYSKESSVFKYINQIDNRYNIAYDYELLLNPIKLISDLKKSLEDYCGIQINSFKDSDLVLKKKLIP